MSSTTSQFGSFYCPNLYRAPLPSSSIPSIVLFTFQEDWFSFNSCSYWSYLFPFSDLNWLNQVLYHLDHSLISIAKTVNLNQFIIQQAFKQIFDLFFCSEKCQLTSLSQQLNFHPDIYPWEFLNFYLSKWRSLAFLLARWTHCHHHCRK